MMDGHLRRNAQSRAEAMVRMLEAHGVRHIFGLCGDTTHLTLALMQS